MIDFSKLGKLTDQELDELSQQRDRDFIESDLKERAKLSVSRQLITLTEDPYIRFHPSGEMTAVFPGTNSSGKKFNSILKSMVNEEEKDFSKRI